MDQLKYPVTVENSEKSSRATSPSSNQLLSQEIDEAEEKDESMAIFNLELLVRITIQNKDRVTEIWPSVVDHMKKLIEVAVEAVQKRPFLLERSVNGLLRMAVRLARKEDLSSLTVQSLALLETLNAQGLFQVN